MDSAKDFFTKLILIAFVVILLILKYHDQREIHKLNQSVGELRQSFVSISQAILDTNHVTTSAVALDAKSIKLITGLNEKITNFTATKFIIHDSFKTTLRDSIILREYEDQEGLFIDTLKMFYYNDSYLMLNCNIDGDSTYCLYSYTDSVTAMTYLHQNYKWYQFRKKQKFDSKWSVLTDVKFTNPKVKIKSVKSLYLKK